MFYPIELEHDSNGTLLVTFKDLPWVHTFGETEADALERAAEALDTAIEYLIRQRQPVPTPSKQAGPGVALSAMAGVKIALHNIMVSEGVTKAELKRRLNVHGPQVDRLLDTRHASRIDEVERAFGTFGRRLELTVRPKIAGAARERPSASSNARRSGKRRVVTRKR